MNTWHRATLAAVVTCGALLPFVGKAFHIDDTLFLYTARQILCDPLRPFDFEVNWYGTPRPMWEITKNPPLNSYWLAALVGLFGESETALHLGFLPFSVASIVLMYLLAARLTSEPLLPALMLLASPSFLVSATNVMCDVPLLACWLGSVLAFMHGLERRDWRLLGLAGVLAGLAGLTKYTGLSLVPLLLAYAWLRRRSLPKESLVLLIPIVMVGAWSLHGTILQGKSHVLDTTSYQFPRRYSFSSLMVQGFACLTFTGGCSFGLALLLPWMKKRRWHWAVAALGTVLVSALTPPALWEDLGVGHSCLALLMAFAGLMLICVAVRGAQEGIAGEGALLLLWLAGMLFYVAVVNWTVAGR
ncbi:MAG: glycosyltransferase family 39 protein, partial [Planctomycetes bacterium]|nr:glycosyltransferase family 39 protein [Planctomycetota bacterium]